MRETWVFDTTKDVDYEFKSFNVGFTCNDVHYDSMANLDGDYADWWYLDSADSSKNVQVFVGLENPRLKEDYKTIVLDESATGEFLSWISEFATKQETELVAGLYDENDNLKEKEQK